MTNNQENNLNKKAAGNDQVAEPVAHQHRREVVQKLGKFAAYAAPFTVLAFTKKAAAATSRGPGKH